jgi:methyl-accepting chemotaxis protein
MQPRPNVQDLPDRPGAAAASAVPADEGTAFGLIQRWLELSELERRAFNALCQELTVSSDLVESSTTGLSERFQALAAIAQGQLGRMEHVIAIASSLNIDGESVTLDAALDSVQAALMKAIETILFVSKHAMRMVYSLEDVARDVRAMEQCTAEIETINQQARYLALNATIEASRSGTAGAAFGVIAREMKDLSKATDQTAGKVRGRIEAAGRGVRQGLDVLREIATMDLSKNILAKERIDALIAGIIAQHGAFGAVLGDAARSSAELTGTIGEIIGGMQFQDRTKQHIAQVIDTLHVLEEGTASLRRETETAFPDQFQIGTIDAETLARIVQKQTLGGMKERILTRLLTGGGGEPEEPARDAEDDGGSVELF